MKTFLPVDSGLLSTDPQVQQGRCDAIAGIEALLDGGIFADDTGVLARTAAGLAAQDPNGVSPLGFAPLTNLQTLLLAQSQTGTVFGTDPASFHLFAGTFYTTGLPDRGAGAAVGLRRDRGADPVRGCRWGQRCGRRGPAGLRRQ